jgi:hypothetical protein
MPDAEDPSKHYKSLDEAIDWRNEQAKLHFGVVARKVARVGEGR